MTASSTAETIADRFRVVEPVGRGAFGRVFRVIEVASGAPRALKVVPRGAHEAMLLDEFEQLARLRHPSLPKVFEVGRTRAAIDDLAAGAPYFVAEWIAGARSDGVAWTGELGPRVWALLADLAGALAVIHAAGLVHGDVTPSNVLVDEERAVLVDLGLAAAGGARGTPAYMAPEALAGHVEPRSDLYGLGATVIRLVTGRPLFEGATLGELAARILAGAAPRALPGVPAPLADLITRLVAREPDARPASALALLDELDQLAPAIAPGSSRRARPKVGPPPAPGAWAGAAEATRAIGRALGDPASAAVVVVGAAASGARQLAERAARAWQVEQVAHQRPSAVVIGAVDEVGAALGVPAASTTRAWIEQLARAARRSHGVVLVDATEDARHAELVAALVRAPGERPVVVVTEHAPAPRPGVVILAAPLLDVDGTRALAAAMLGRTPSAAWAAALHAASAGLPLTAIELVRSIAGERDPFAVDWSTRTTAGATELRAAQLRALPAAARRAAVALAAWGGRARVEHVLATLRADGGKPVVGLADLVELERAGLARRTGDTLALDRAALAAVEASAPPKELAALASHALASVAVFGDPRHATQDGAPRAPSSDVSAGHTLAASAGHTLAAGATAPRPPRVAPLAIAGLLERAPLDAATAELACDVAEQLLAHGRADRALGLARRVIAQTSARSTEPPSRGTDPTRARSGEPSTRTPETTSIRGRDPSMRGAEMVPARGGEPSTRTPETTSIRGRDPSMRGAEMVPARGGEPSTRTPETTSRGAAIAARAGLIAARAAAAQGAYEEAMALARAAEAAGADAVQAQLVIARAAQRAGNLDAAEAVLAHLVAEHPGHAEAAGAYARLLVTRSRYADARAVALGGPTLGGVPLAALRAEAAGLAAFYLGELDDADAAFAALELGAHAANDTATVGRALSLRGMVAQQRGQLGLASDRYREATRRLADVGELHAAATAELNLGTVLAERGRSSEALPRLAAAGRVFAELGATTELCAAELNRGNALLAVGQIDDARVAAEAALARADGAPHLRAFALLVLGDARRRLGDDGGAIRSYREALTIAVDRGDAHAQISAYIALAEAGVRERADAAVEALCASTDDRDRWTIARGRLALHEHATLHEPGGRPPFSAPTSDSGSVPQETGARPRFSSPPSSAPGADAVSSAEETGARPRFSPPTSDSGSVSQETGARPRFSPESDAVSGAVLGEETGARPRFSPESDAVSGAVLGELAEACAEVGARAAEADRLERAFRGYAVAARLAERARDAGRAVELADKARGAHASMIAVAAPAFRAAMERDPDRERLPGRADEDSASGGYAGAGRANAGRAGAGHAGAGRAAGRAGEAPHLRRLLTLSRRLNTEASVERILDDVIDTAIELTLAERGFLLLRQPGGELAAVVSRNFTSGDLAASGTATVSRSIAERAAQTGEPVLTVDAGVDERFGAAASVAALRLRSVLAVPLRQRGSIIGCIYVDHRLRGGAFDDAAASVLGELADIAAIAIENARLTGELRATTRAVDELNTRLSAELADRDAELVRVKADLPDRDRLRERYDKIIGRSPAMLKVLDVVDRAAATSLPVVIVGESGTGKELVARALHDHGPRKAGAFVAINCSAVPETLLESELFGHVRGAFTGAERDRRGLFEVADGGTLFLDEIADTGPAMQAKLLRVLQDGVIRRVGDTQTRKVDVRVVAASQLSLAELVAAGRFREDLRFRLEVITVPMPPLRDRDGDVPLLVEHLLAALSRDRATPRLTRAALRALSQHRWPGNVRELENALARGVAMGGDVIDVGDLPEAIGAIAARPEPARPTLGEDLRLKPALAATEQAYIGAAMTRAKNNQTVAARLLGLSRFGLQKKLRRLAGDGDGEDD